VGWGAKVVLDFQLRPFEEETALGLAVEEQGGPALGFAVPDATPVVMGRVPTEASHRHSSTLLARLVLEAECVSWNPSPRWVVVVTLAAKNWSLHRPVEVAMPPGPASWHLPRHLGLRSGCHGARARVCLPGLWHDGD